MVHNFRIEEQEDNSTAYEITDHLGNVRALVREDVNTYTATMEDNGAAEYTNPRVKEMNFFHNLFETEVDDANMNHTSPEATVVTNPSKSAYLFWQSGMTGMEATDKAVGPAAALRVNPGDKVQLETWARFENKTEYDRGFDLAMLSQILGATFAATAGFDGMTPTQTASTFNGGLGAEGFGSDDSDDERPFAFLNYAIFNDDMQMVDAGWQRVPATAGFENGEEGLPNGHQRLAFEQPIEIGESGYIYVWVSNESENTRVWFDDLSITHTRGIVTQATDYGVWGDVLREQKSDENKYRYGYQGQFAEKDEETGWNHFELREYDPVIGRWLVLDPAGQYWSPYLAFGNSPINRVDPNGGTDTDPKCKECNNGAVMLPEVEVSADKWSKFDEWLYQAYEGWSGFKGGDGIAFFGSNDFFGAQPVFQGRKGRASHFITDPGSALITFTIFDFKKGPWPKGHIPNKGPMTVLEVFETAKDGYDAVDKLKRLEDGTIETLNKIFQKSAHSGLSKAERAQHLRDSTDANGIKVYGVKYDVSDPYGKDRDTLGVIFYNSDHRRTYHKLGN